MSDLISREYVLTEYDRQHQGPPGGARKIMEEAPAVDAVPVEWLRQYAPKKWSMYYMQAAVEIIIEACKSNRRRKMADFVRTMKNWKRMCNAMERERPHDACNGCPLEGYGCPAIYEDNSHVDFAEAKNTLAELLVMISDTGMQLYGTDIRPEKTGTMDGKCLEDDINIVADQAQLALGMMNEIRRRLV